jgi:hypothetical protein
MAGDIDVGFPQHGISTSTGTTMRNIFLQASDSECSSPYSLTVLPRSPPQIL